MTSLIHGLAHRVRDLLRHRFIHRLHHRVALLAGLVHGLAHRVGDLLRAGLVDRLAHGRTNLTGPRLGDRLADRVGLLAGLVHGLAHRIRDLLRERLPHRLAHGVVDGSRTVLPHRLADGVFDALERLLRLVADAVDLLLFDDLLADRLVAGVLLLLVHDVLHHPRARARRLGGTVRFAGRRLTTRTLRPGMRETDRSQFRGPVLIAGDPAVGGVGSVDRRRDTAKCQQTH